MSDELIVEGRPNEPEAAPAEPQETPQATIETPAEEAAVEEAEVPAEGQPEGQTPPPAPHRGAVAELIQNRKALREEKESRLRLEGELAAIRRQIDSGQLLQRPQQNPTEVEQQRLTATAQRLGLVKQDGTPDLEAAGRAEAWARDVVRQEVEPLRNLTLQDKATLHVNYAVEHARKSGLGDEAVQIIGDAYRQVLQQPNGAQVLSQKEVAEAIWYQGLGRAAAAGKLTPTQMQQAVAQPQQGTTPPNPAPAVGRRATGAALQLSPAVQRVYADAGLDPTKGYSAKVKIDNPAAIPLE